MTRPIILAALCAGLAAASPAVAQETSVFDPRRDTTESMQHFAKLLAHADCLMGAKQSAAAVLADKPNSKAERGKTAKLRGSVKACPVTGLENIHSLVRGTLAEAMYRRQFTAAPAADPVRAKAFVDGEKLFHSDRVPGDQVMAAVVSCMVAASPQTAHALLSTTHGTAAEDSAMNALFAAGEKCGAGTARPANLSRSFVRAFVADSAWRYGQAVAR